ncbi:MAG: NUDIX hydrolase [Acidimicrobiales bacterium]
MGAGSDDQPTGGPAYDHPVAPPARGFPVGPPDLVRGGPQLIPRPADWRMGAPAPWAHLPSSVRAPDLGAVRSCLASAPAPKPPPQHLTSVVDPERASAVLALLADDDGGPHVLLTRRSWDLRSHRGEVSFPGGRHEPEDPDLTATALRETEEEVGIDPSSVEIIGRLDELATVSSRSVIVPFVGVVTGRPALRLDPREVAAARYVSLVELLSDGVYHEEIWRRDGIERPLWFFELHGDTVWGATASMLRQLLCLVTGTVPTGSASGD